jgi:hypothetical protein
LAINVKSITCPACGAKVNYEENRKTVKCDFCGTFLDLTEEYGEKRDRERDDIQDMQIRHIMNNMRGNSTPNSNVNTQKAKRTAIIIIIVFVFIFSGSVIYGVMGNPYRRSSSKNNSTNTETEKDINPFDRYNIRYYGVSGAAKAQLYDTNVHAISSLEKTTTNLENLSNGDTITVKYSKNTVKDGSTKYNLTQTEKTFTVNGLEEYVADINDVSEEDLSILKKNAIEKAIYECDDEDFGYVKDSFDIYAIYSMVKKDYSKQRSVFILSFDYKDPDDKKTKTGYFMAEYSNIKKLSDGNYKINFNADVFSYNRESYFGGFTLLSAHSTWDAVYTDVYLNNKAEWSIHEDYKK